MQLFHEIHFIKIISISIYRVNAAEAHSNISILFIKRTKISYKYLK